MIDDELPKERARPQIELAPEDEGIYVVIPDPSEEEPWPLPPTRLRHQEDAN